MVTRIGAAIAIAFASLLFVWHLNSMAPILTPTEKIAVHELLSSSSNPRGSHSNGSIPSAKLHSFVILKRPRTGSTWLQRQMETIPGIKSIFQPLTDPHQVNPWPCPPDFYTNALLSMLRGYCPNNLLRQKSVHTPHYYSKTCEVPTKGCGGNETPIEAAGILINKNYIPDNTIREVHLASPSTKFVHLYRTNIVKQAVSLLKQVNQGILVTKKEEDELTIFGNHGTTTSARATRGVSIDVDVLLSAINQTIKVLHDFKSWIHSQGIDDYIEFTYEDLQRNNTETLAWMFQRLGMDAFGERLSHLYSVRSKKIGQENLCDGLLNCAYVKERLSSYPCLLEQFEDSAIQAWTIPETLKSPCKAKSLRFDQ